MTGCGSRPPELSPRSANFWVCQTRFPAEFFHTRLNRSALPHQSGLPGSIQPSSSTQRKYAFPKPAQVYSTCSINCVIFSSMWHLLFLHDAIWTNRRARHLMFPVLRPVRYPLSTLPPDLKPLPLYAQRFSMTGGESALFVDRQAAFKVHKSPCD